MLRYGEAFVGRFLAPWNRQDVDGTVRLAIAGAFEMLLDIHYQPIRSLFGEDMRCWSSWSPARRAMAQCD